MKDWLIKYKAGVIPILGVYLWLVIQTAWVSDDAYITLRSMENFIHGYGPVFNIGERVQVFTHPLWFLGQSLANLILNAWRGNPLGDGQSYFLNAFLSIGISALSMIVLIYGLAASNKGAVLGVVILTTSKAYLDYSTSGLENPLTHLILILFLGLFVLFNEYKPWRVFTLTLLAALGGLDRLDTLLIYLPALAFLFFKNTKKVGSLIMVGLGFLPLILWELFSLFYYGFPFPNTAYAKINTGIPIFDLVRQGFYYYQNSLRLDPITLIVILVISVGTLFGNNHQARMISVGIVLYLLYILSIGGDFMSGRYFSTPLLASTVLIVTSKFGLVDFSESSTRSSAGGRYFFLLALILIIGVAPIFLIPERAPGYGIGAEGGHRIYVDAHDVSDERRVYNGMRLIRRLELGPLVSEFAREKWIFDAQAPVKVKLVGPLGFTGYILGPNAHVIDLNSLADPLMPRMPLYQIGEWRIGHFRHFIPPGYLETLRSGENQISDRNIGLYYEKLLIVVRGDLWNWRRLIEIWNLNMGKYDYLIENIAVTP